MDHPRTTLQPRARQPDRPPPSIARHVSRVAAWVRLEDEMRSIAMDLLGPNGSDELADASAEASRESDVVILAHHGCSTLGDTVEMAWRRALNLEEAAVNTFRCLQLGDTETTFPADQLGTVRHR